MAHALRRCGSQSQSRSLAPLAAALAGPHGHRRHLSSRQSSGGEGGSSGRQGSEGGSSGSSGPAPTTTTTTTTTTTADAGATNAADDAQGGLFARLTNRAKSALAGALSWPVARSEAHAAVLPTSNVVSGATPHTGTSAAASTITITATTTAGGGATTATDSGSSLSPRTSRNDLAADPDVVRRRRLILDGAAMSRVLQYRHHILGAMREHVPNAYEAAAWLAAMVSEGLSIDAADAEHILHACITSRAGEHHRHTPLVSSSSSSSSLAAAAGLVGTAVPDAGDAAATAMCLGAMAAGGLQPKPEMLTAALELLGSERARPRDAAMAVRVVLDYSHVGAIATSWHAPPRYVLSALVVRAEGGDGEWWWPTNDANDDASRLVSALDESSGPLARELTSIIASRSVMRCAEAQPPRSQLALNLYRGLTQRHDQKMDDTAVYAVVRALCLGADYVRDGGGAQTDAQAPLRPSPSVALDILSLNNTKRLSDDYMYAHETVAGVSVPVQSAVLGACVRAATREFETDEGRKWNFKTLARVVPILPLANVLISSTEHIDQPMIEVFHAVLLALRKERVGYKRWFLRRLEPKVLFPDESPDLVPPGTTPEQLDAWRDELSRFLGLIIASYAELARDSDNNRSARTYMVPVQEPALRALAVLKRMEASGPQPNECVVASSPLCAFGCC
jgi:hypothetical protein